MTMAMSVVTSQRFSRRLGIHPEPRERLRVKEIHCRPRLLLHVGECRPRPASMNSKRSMTSHQTAPTKDVGVDSWPLGD